MLIVNGIVHTMEVGTIPDGYVRIQGSRIAQVGRVCELSELADSDGVIDAQGGHILPGLIDVHCHL